MADGDEWWIDGSIMVKQKTSHYQSRAIMVQIKHAVASRQSEWFHVCRPLIITLGTGLTGWMDWTGLGWTDELAWTLLYFDCARQKGVQSTKAKDPVQRNRAPGRNGLLGSMHMIVGRVERESVLYVCTVGTE